MLGPIINSSSLFIGGLIGIAGSKWIPARVKSDLPLIFGCVTIALGTMFAGRAAQLSVVALATVLGTIVGELLNLEYGLTIGMKKALGKRMGNLDKTDNKVDQIITLIPIFCLGTMGIFGSLHEGVTHDPGILITKSILDFFSGIIFASFLGLSVALIAVPQFLIQSLLYFSGSTLSPLMTADMMANFSSCGGILFLASGMRLCNIKTFPVINMLPALILVCPLTAFWVRFLP